MTRINRPDTLRTELRDIKRRLHALETAQRATTAQSAAVQTTATGAESPTRTPPEDEPSQYPGTARPPDSVPRCRRTTEKRS